ncbi:hypothetical protein R3P38DRAFT_2804111 [Favolaschia claudopus]|uniref:Uncharacterized protein n=1 Tax=Favolaschia claudopus TaxID=2862362 RepID=A0AAV9ZR19_9AGAR
MSSVNADASIAEGPTLSDQNTISEDGWLKESEWSAVIDRLNENGGDSPQHRESEVVRCDDPVQEEWLRRLDRLTPDPFKTIVRLQQEARERRDLREEREAHREEREARREERRARREERKANQKLLIARQTCRPSSLTYTRPLVPQPLGVQSPTSSPASHFSFCAACHSAHSLAWSEESSANLIDSCHRLTGRYSVPASFPSPPMPGFAWSTYLILVTRAKVQWWIWIARPKREIEQDMRMIQFLVRRAKIHARGLGEIQQLRRRIQLIRVRIQAKMNAPLDQNFQIDDISHVLTEESGERIHVSWKRRDAANVKRDPGHLDDISQFLSVYAPSSTEKRLIRTFKVGKDIELLKLPKNHENLSFMESRKRTKEEDNESPPAKRSRTEIGENLSLTKPLDHAGDNIDPLGQKRGRGINCPELEGDSRNGGEAEEPEVSVFVGPDAENNEEAPDVLELYLIRRRQQRLACMAAVAEMMETQKSRKSISPPATTFPTMMHDEPELDADEQALADATDKNCKIETLRAKEDGEDLREDLQEWLYRYIGRPPTRQSPPGCVPGAAVKERVAKRAATREEALALGIAPPINRKPAGYVAGAAVRRRVAERQTAREASAAEVRKMGAHRESHVDRRGDWFFRGGPTIPPKVEVVACEGAKPVSENAGMLTKA